MRNGRVTIWTNQHRRVTRLLAYRVIRNLESAGYTPRPSQRLPAGSRLAIRRRRLVLIHVRLTYPLGKIIGSSDGSCESRSSSITLKRRAHSGYRLTCTVRESNPRFVDLDPLWSTGVHSKPICEIAGQSEIVPDDLGCYYLRYYLSCGQHLETSEISVLDGLLSRRRRTPAPGKYQGDQPEEGAIHRR